MEIPSDQRRTTSIETPNLGPNADIESGVLRANGKRKGSRRRRDETVGNIAGRGAGFCAAVCGECIAYVDSGNWLSFDGGRRPLTYERTFGSIPAG